MDFAEDIKQNTYVKAWWCTMERELIKSLIRWKSKPKQGNL